jgi:hypothetical protein
MRLPPEWQHIVSNYQVLGVIPLDKLLHVLVGILLTLVVRRLGKGLRAATLLVAGVALAKEVNDFFVLNSSLGEQLLDILATVAYPLLVWSVASIRRRAAQSNSGA